MINRFIHSFYIAFGMITSFNNEVRFSRISQKDSIIVTNREIGIESNILVLHVSTKEIMTKKINQTKPTSTPKNRVVVSV